MAHGIARFSPDYCKDSLRWRSLGKTEAKWFEDNVFRFTYSLSNEPYSFQVEDGPLNTNLRGFGLPDQVLKDSRNPGFYDPFHPTKDITLVNYRYIITLHSNCQGLVYRKIGLGSFTRIRGCLQRVGKSRFLCFRS